jgi:homoserine dehydrogenase
VGVIGHGGVGQGVVQLLEERRELLTRIGGPFTLVGVAVRDPARPREGLAPGLLTTPEALLADPRLDVLVEVAGGVEPAFRWVAEALRRGKAVVTANKALLAERAEELESLRRESGGRLFCEAAVAGGLPILQVLDRGLLANRVVRVEGILNGTCNFILTRMERERLSFAEALARAQALGFAEADPGLDVSGGDTAHKLAVLASLATGHPVSSRGLFTEGIEKLTAFDLQWAEAHGLRVKLLAIGRFGGGRMELRVHPTLVPKSHLISQVMDEVNAVAVEGDLVGPQLYSGKGAGRLPTASAVVGDVAQALRGERPLGARPQEEGGPWRVVPMGEVVSRHYVHLEVVDRPGVVARVAGTLAAHGISIASLYQPEAAHGSQVPLVFTTHPAPDAALTRALAGLAAEPFLAAPAVHVRMEA